jgi:acid phosphatase
MPPVHSVPAVFRRPLTGNGTRSVRIAACAGAGLLLWLGFDAGRALARTEVVPLAEHVIVVVMENHAYDQVQSMPYTAGLIAAQTSFRSSYALTHPSQPNYLGLWSGDTFGVGDACPPQGSPYSAENLGQACQAAGLSWRSYAENLPWSGYSGCSADNGLYVRRHCPWTHFNNLDHARERPFSDLAADIANGALPRLAFVIPNQCDNTHDCPVATGDDWLAAHLPAMIDAVGSAGFVVLTWDEDDDHYANHILTVFAGGLVKHGYVSARIITHYTVLRTICDALGLAPFGAATAEVPILDVWADDSGVMPDGGEPEGAWLSPVFPNPSSDGFEAVLRLPDARFGSPGGAAVYDAGGGRVALLPVAWNTGEGRLRWSGRRDNGRPAPSGVYFLRVRAGETVMQRTLVLVGGR